MSRLYRYSPPVHAALSTLYRSLRLYVYNGSAKAWAGAARHFWLRARGIPSPTFVTVAVTYRCQARCVHCYANSPERPHEPEPTTEQLKSVISQVKALGAMAVHFSGGEPLLRKDLFELIRYARDLGLLTRINSNGLLLDEENTGQLKAAGLTECGVSLDSADPETHDRLRGVPGLHEKVLQGIRNLARQKIPIRIMSLALKEKVPDGVAETIRPRPQPGRQLYVCSDPDRQRGLGRGLQPGAELPGTGSDPRLAGFENGAPRDAHRKDQLLRLQEIHPVCVGQRQCDPVRFRPLCSRQPQGAHAGGDMEAALRRIKTGMPRRLPHEYLRRTRRSTAARCRSPRSPGSERRSGDSHARIEIVRRPCDSGTQGIGNSGTPKVEARGRDELNGACAFVTGFWICCRQVDASDDLPGPSHC